MTTDTANEFRQAADRALDFLAAHVDKDGRCRIDPNDPGLHFKLPYVFAYGDRRQLALKVLDHIERNLLADDGSFQRRPVQRTGQRLSLPGRMAGLEQRGPWGAL